MKTMQAMLQQVLTGQANAASQINKQIAEIHTRVDQVQNDFNAKFDGLASHVKQLDYQIAQRASASTRPAGQLPGKPETNPKEFCGAVFSKEETLADIAGRSRTEYDSQDDEDEEQKEETSRLLYGSVTKEARVGGDATIDDSEEEDPEEDEEEDPEENPEEDPEEDEEEDPEEDPEEEDGAEEDIPREEAPTDESKLPSPGRALTRAQTKFLSCFKEDMEKIGVALPIKGDLSKVPLHKKLIEDVLANREKVEEVMNNYEVPIKILPITKMLQKLEDPGSFTISCLLGDLELDDALCDSGASINVIPFEMVKKLGVTDLKPYPVSIMFGDASAKKPVGVLADYPIRIGNCLVPADFIVMEMAQDSKVPLILGTPFLNTAGATMDFTNKRVVLKRVDDKKFYHIKPSPKYACNFARADMRIKGRSKRFKDESEEAQGIGVRARRKKRLKPNIKDPFIEEVTTVPLSDPPFA